MTLFTLDYCLSRPVSCTAKSQWGLGLQYMELGGHEHSVHYRKVLNVLHIPLVLPNIYNMIEMSFLSMD